MYVKAQNYGLKILYARLKDIKKTKDEKTKKFKNPVVNWIDLDLVYPVL